MNYVALIIDYYLQCLEANISKGKAYTLAREKCEHWHLDFEDFDTEDFEFAINLLNRMNWRI